MGAGVYQAREPPWGRRGMAGSRFGTFEGSACHGDVQG